MDDLIFGIDIGSTKVCAIIAECTDNNTVNVLGVGVAPSRNSVKQGNIVDLRSTTQAIVDAISELDKSFDTFIPNAYVSISGANITSINSKGTIELKGNNQEIKNEDLLRAIEKAKSSITIPSHQSIINTLVSEYAVDEQTGILDPTGMVGSKLEANVHIISGAITSIQNIKKCCENADTNVEDLVLQQYASSLAVLNEEEKKMGVVLVDIGGGTTDLIIYQNGCVVYSGCIDVGGELITRDLTVGLKASYQQAEKLKVEYGIALTNQADETKTFEIQGPGGESIGPTNQRFMANIIESCLELDIFQKVKDHIEKHVNSLDMLPAGVVITGGTSLLKCCKQLASEVIGLPVRIGYPINITSDKIDIEKVNKPQFATAIGLIRYGAQIERKEQASKPLGGFLSKIKSYIEKHIEKLFTN